MVSGVAPARASGDEYIACDYTLFPEREERDLMEDDRRDARPDPWDAGLTRRRALSLFGLAPAAAAAGYLFSGCEDERNAEVTGAREIRGQAPEVRTDLWTGIRNVKSSEFGAVGDGGTDDTAAIQAAIDSLPAGSVRGGTVLLPVGHYKITSPLRLHGRSIRLVGQGGTSAVEADPGYGSVLLAATSGMTLVEIGDGRDINQFGPVLENLSFVADRGADGVTLVANRSTIQSTFKNCYFRRAKSGVHFTSTLRDGGLGDSGWAYFEQCFFYGLDNGILGENDDPQQKLSNQFVLLGGGFTNCAYPIRIAGGSGGARIFGPKINNCDVGIYVGGSACQIFAVHIENCGVGVRIESDGVSPNSGEANFVCGGVIVGYDSPSGKGTGVRVGPTARNTTVMNTRYVNLSTNFEDEGTNTLHVPVGGPIELGGTGGGDLLRFAHDGRPVAGVRAENGLVFDMRDGNAKDSFAIELPGGTPSSRFEIRNGDGELCSVSGDGLLSLSKGGMNLRSLPSAPRMLEGNGVVLFASENDDGKTELRVRFGSGAEQVLATEP